MFAAVVYFNDGLTIIKNDDFSGLLASLASCLQAGQEEYAFGVALDSFDAKKDEVLAMEEIDDYESVFDDLSEHIVAMPRLPASEIFVHNRE